MSMLAEFGRWLTETEAVAWEKWQQTHQSYWEGQHDAYAVVLTEWRGGVTLLAVMCGQNALIATHCEPSGMSWMLCSICAMQPTCER